MVPGERVADLTAEIGRVDPMKPVKDWFGKNTTELYSVLTGFNWFR